MAEHRPTDASRAKLRAVLREKLTTGRVSCGGDCGRILDPATVYRCYYCGLWFGACCAGAHFGGQRPLIGGEASAA